MTRLCPWDGRELSRGSRRDAIYCSTRCRQAAHRAKVEPSRLSTAATPRRLAYADPPYPGLARRYYADHPDYAGEVDHRELIRRLSTYDGWALSTSAKALPDVLALCVEAGQPVRVAAWVRGHRPHPRAAVVSAWEPVVFTRARAVAARDSTAAGATPDALVGVSPRSRSTLPTAVIGMKPPAFCEWLFRLLGARPGDTLDDLFPGSGMVARAWAQYVAPDVASGIPATRRLEGWVSLGDRLATI